MTPEERSLLDDLFQRLRQAEGQPRDPDAERFIRETIQAQPAAAYYMTQSVLVQQHALTAAQQRIEELERQLKDAQQQRPQSSGGVGSFLGNALGLGRREEPRPAAPQPVSQPPMAQRGSPWGAPAQPAYPQQQQPGGGFRGPWGGGAPGGVAPQGGGGSFMGGALQTAAGVAGGMLAASAISSLMHGAGNPFGAAATSHGMQPTSTPAPAAETATNTDHAPAAEPPQSGYQEAAYQPDNADYGMDDGDVGGGEDDSWA